MLIQNMFKLDTEMFKNAKSNENPKQCKLHVIDIIAKILNMLGRFDKSLWIWLLFCVEVCLCKKNDNCCCFIYLFLFIFALKCFNYDQMASELCNRGNICAHHEHISYGNISSINSGEIVSCALLWMVSIIVSYKSVADMIYEGKRVCVRYETNNRMTKTGPDAVAGARWWNTSMCVDWHWDWKRDPNRNGVNMCANTFFIFPSK